MHKALICMILVAAFSQAVSAEEFCLRPDKSGHVYGPFSTDAGSEVTIGSATFTVVRKDGSRSPAETKLRATKLELEIRDTPLNYAIDMFRMKLEAGHHGGQAINLVLLPPASSAHNDKSLAPSRRVSHRVSYPTVTLVLTDGTALQALQHLVDQAGYTYHISGNVVTLSQKK